MMGASNLYCKYSFHYGPDWSFVNVGLKRRRLSCVLSVARRQGLEHGMSQIAHKAGSDESFTWNFPIDVSFRSTNVHGWPQLAISVYGINLLGRDVIQGYGCVHLPTTPGRCGPHAVGCMEWPWVDDGRACAHRHERIVRLFTPMSSSFFQQFTAWWLPLPVRWRARAISR
jgi:hypothetical protein